MPEFDPLDIIYTPQDITRAGTEYLKARRANKGNGVPMGLKTIDRDFIPAMPGELISIIGRPGNGKTGFMMRWARYRARWLYEKGILDRVVVYCSWEQSIEELYAFNVAAEERLSITSMSRGEISDEEWESILSAGVKRITLPLWFIGHSMERRRKRPVINMTNLGLALTNIENQLDTKMQIDMVFMDYLQRIPAEGHVESKTISTSDILDRAKDGALAFGCPFVLGVQARREVDDRDDPIPLMDDGQWTSNVEQSSDKIFSVTRPAKYKNENERFKDIKVEGNCQMYVSLLKQKLGIDNRGYWVYFDPIYNKLDELETKANNHA
jgi:replicative DNA helicase